MMLRFLCIASVVNSGMVFAKECDAPISLDFIMQAPNSLLEVIEDDIVADLKKLNIMVNTRKLEKAQFNKAMKDGDFHMCFSETWGPPYDPHSYAASWKAGNEAHKAALKSTDYTSLTANISDVLIETSLQAREAKWNAILTAMHQLAVDLPFSGKRIPTVLSKRLTGYTPGQQQFDYPVHTLMALSGSATITVAPGSQTGLFNTIGRMDPHTYRPNEFWASNWVYEGLVAYGANGVIEPSLATAWTISDKPGGGQEYRFELRQNVLFHDGSEWNCNAAKLNFDHVLAGTTNPNGPHRWYDLPRKITAWTCASAYELVVTTIDKYYPLLQELTYIRPLRMLSPASFKNGPSTDPTAQNSCNEEASDDDYHEGITCAGINEPSGTGPFQYNETMPNGDVTFKRNSAYWRGPPQIHEIIVKKFQTHDGVMAALLDGSLDAVMGADVLKPADVAKLRLDYTSQFHVFLGPPIQNRIIIINSNKIPTDNIQLRKAIIHAVNKAAIIDKELYGLAAPADALFPKDAPYCNVDLTPRWDYDFEKAQLLRCPPTVITDAVENVTEIKAERDALEAQLAKEKEDLAKANADKEALQKENDKLRGEDVNAACKNNYFASTLFAIMFLLLL